MNIYEKLLKIQTGLKAPKSQYNSFGNYRYRSCEDVLETLKPLLAEVRVTLTINDEIIQIGDRYYIKSTATLTDIGNEQTIKCGSVQVSAYAREDETKKGMDLAQVTGSTSSYARKYALNGLFCIDDTKDSDATNTHGQAIKEAVNQPKKDKLKNTPIKGSNADTLACSSCKTEIALAVKTYSEKNFGKALCRDCQTKEKK